MHEIKQSTPINSYISNDGVLHLVQDTTFLQPLRIYDQEIGADIDLSDHTFKASIKSSAGDPVGFEFEIKKASSTQILISISYEFTNRIPAGFYYYEIDSLNNSTGIKENIIRGRCIVYQNIV